MIGARQAGACPARVRVGSSSTYGASAGNVRCARSDGLAAAGGGVEVPPSRCRPFDSGYVAAAVAAVEFPRTLTSTNGQKMP